MMASQVPVQPPADSRDENRIFVKDLPTTITEEELRGHFGKFGEIVDVYIPKVCPHC